MAQQFKSDWDNSNYYGEINKNWFHGVGILQFEKGVKYVGSFLKGDFSDNGKVEFPDGGIFYGDWENGELKSGYYVFPDSLEYIPNGWNYLINSDRRFNREIINDYTNFPNLSSESANNKGSYDSIGNNHYDPKTSLVHNNYNPYITRVPSKKEVIWTQEKCRRF